ncbi:MAG: hypothetical protein RJB62_448 [Pseudomonadota bacterium]|jgi:thiol-disulfide isomerase/thioredoxin
MLAIALGTAAATVAVLAVLYGNRPAPVHDEGVANDAAPAALTLPASLPGVVPSDGMPMAPEAGFFDGAGAPINLADFRGRFVVLNLWATWCAPCVAELPALARAQEALGDDVLILPVDMEDKSAEEITAFLAQNGAEMLPVYIDREFAVMRAFEAFSVGLPYTIFIDAEGRQVATASGPQEWDDADAIAYIRQMSGG